MVTGYFYFELLSGVSQGTSFAKARSADPDRLIGDVFLNAMILSHKNVGKIAIIAL